MVCSELSVPCVVCVPVLVVVDAVVVDSDPSTLDVPVLDAVLLCVLSSFTVPVCSILFVPVLAIASVPVLALVVVPVLVVVSVISVTVFKPYAFESLPVISPVSVPSWVLDVVSLVSSLVVVVFWLVSVCSWVLVSSLLRVLVLFSSTTLLSSMSVTDLPVPSVEVELVLTRATSLSVFVM